MITFVTGYLVGAFITLIILLLSVGRDKRRYGSPYDERPMTLPPMRVVSDHSDMDGHNQEGNYDP